MEKRKNIMPDTPLPSLLDAPQRRTGALAATTALAALALLGAGLLWARFGEAVYVSGLMTAIMNCF